MGMPVRQLPEKFMAAVGGRDPGFDALRRAIRAALVIPIIAAVALHLGGPQTPLFAIFGSVALLILADFPGSRTRRAVSYCSLAVVGYAFISVATTLARPGWLATLSMLVVGVVVAYTAILGSSFSAGQRSALMLFVVPVATPEGPLSDRLLGWTLALAFSIPAALFLLPPQHHGRLRTRAQDVCEGLAGYVRQGPEMTATKPPTVDVIALMDRLRQTYLGSNARPAGLSAGSRAIIRVVDDLEWLTTQVARRHVQLPDHLRGPAVAVLQRSADILATDKHEIGPSDRASLLDAVEQLRSLIDNSFGTNLDAILADPTDAEAEVDGMRLLEIHTCCSTIALIGGTVAWASAADARPTLQKILGRQLPEAGAAESAIPEYRATRLSLSADLIKNSVITRNALRTGIGLAAAVALVQILPVQHGFWVVLGALSVLRTRALATGTNVLRSVLGTAVGFLVGALIITAIGTDHTALWSVLPIAVFGAAYIPRVISFAAGQAAFTVFVVTLFNVIGPGGWRIGLLRVEDVAIGCAVAIVVGIVMWPRGAATTARAAINYSIAVHARYLQAATTRMTTGSTTTTDLTVAELRTESQIAYRASDDAARQYLSESGSAAERRTPMVKALGRSIRLRTVADSIADLTPTSHPATTGPNLCTVIDIQAAQVTVETVGGVGSVDTDTTGEENTRDHPTRIAAAMVAALRADHEKNGLGINEARPLIATAAYLGELELMRGNRPQ